MPVIRPLDPSISASDLFRALDGLSGRVWLDSVTGERGTSELDIDDIVRRLSRYSFITADPIDRLVARPGQVDPWQELARLSKALPDDTAPSLPPFQGGLVGVVGYEASRWLEPFELADCHRNQHDDLPTPAISFGVYDWTIAIDHLENKTWLICQGFTAADLRGGVASDGAKTLTALPSTARTSAEQRVRNANARADQITELISRRLERRQSRRIDASSANIQAPRRPVRDPIITSNFTSDQFRASVAEIVDRIRGGDSFQVNLAQRLTTPALFDAAELYLRLRESNPAPFAGFYDGGEFQVLSSSPEGFLQIRDRHVETRPIKGTSPRTGDDATDGRLAAELLASEKDRAENIMIVDLMRNDLSRVCTDESVRVSQICQIERYQFVQHLVSVIEGQLLEDVDAVDTLMACFPGGSVTGAPKIEAMKTIAELEPNPRGPYCGSMGYFSCGGDADFNILIRTITSASGQLQIPVGGGITARSVPEAEEAETWAKARGMLKALQRVPSRSGTPVDVNAKGHQADPTVSNQLR